jgi:hypothetical protein
MLEASLCGLRSLCFFPRSNDDVVEVQVVRAVVGLEINLCRVEKANESDPAGAREQWQRNG